MNDTLTNTPETDGEADDAHNLCLDYDCQGKNDNLPVPIVVLADFARKLERERDEWRSRFSRAVEILEGGLHCADNCLCSGRRDVNNIRALLETTTKPTP